MTHCRQAGGPSAWYSVLSQRISRKKFPTWIWYWWLWWKYVEILQICLKSGKSFGNFTWRLGYLFIVADDMNPT